MKKAILSIFAIALILVSCDSPAPQFEERTFPRKQLIEQFTSEYCGYCPDALYCMDEFMESADNDYIVIAHHAGFKNDAYTISESSKIASKLTVSSNPAMSINRDKTMVYGNGTTQRVFDPRYLPYGIDEPINTADLSVALNVEYNDANKTLNIKVNGEIGKEDITTIRLNVVIKESGMVGPQKDYTNTWEGWEEFVHPNTIRAYLTEATGDIIEIKDYKYSAEYNTTIDNKWDANKCSVVAFVTKDEPTARPVLNAEIAPVVKGTTGGVDIKAEGIKLVAVSESYPESGFPRNKLVFESLQCSGKEMMLIDNEAFQSGNYAVQPLLHLVFNVEGDTIAYGTYPINNSLENGTVTAGYRDDEKRQLGASVLYYAIQSYLQQGSISYNSAWFVNAGTVVVSATGVTIDATSKNGSKMQYSYSGAINQSKSKVAAKRQIEHIH